MVKAASLISVKGAGKTLLKILLKVCLSILLLLALGMHTASAQLGFQLTEDHITLKNNSLVTFTARVVNKSSTRLHGKLMISAEPSLQLISQNNLEINLAGNDSIFLPIKVLPAYDLEAGDHIVRITLRQQSENNGTSPDIQDSKEISREARLTLARIKSVSISAVQPSVQLLGNEDSVMVPIRITNTGNVPATVSILTRLPEALTRELLHRPLLIKLGRNVDTTLFVAQRLPRKLPAGDAFQVNILGFYTGGDQFGQASVRVQLLSSEVKEAYAPTANYIVAAPNSISLSAQNAFSQNAYYWLNGGGSVFLPAEARASWHLDGTLYQYDLSHPYLRDTWLNFEKHGNGVTVGNLSRNLDLNIYGRGATAYTMDSLHSNYYEAGLIDHSSDLLQGSGVGGAGNGGFSLKNGMAGWALVRHQVKQSYWQTAAIYQQDELTETNNTLITNDIKWEGKHNIRMEASLGGGLTTDKQDPARQKGGVLASFSISGVIHKKLGFNSSNTFSTGYYPGQRKGAQVFSERFSYQLGKIGLWSALNYYKYKPKTVSSIQRYLSEYGSNRAEIGISTNMHSVSLSFSPYYTSNSSLYYTLQDVLRPEIQAFRLLSQLNYNKNKFSVFLSADLGVGKNSLTDRKEFQWHLNSNLRYGFLSVSSSMQVGSFYATDALNSYLYGSSLYKIYTVTPRVQHYFFNHSLNLTAGLSYNYINSSGRNLSIDTRLQYKLNNNSNLSAGFMRYTTGYYNHAYNSLQLGITTKLPTARIGTQKNSLELFFFKDLNDNGAFDKGVDSVAAGQQITVGNRSFLTDKNGRVLYKNLYAGTYNVNNLRNTQWFADGQTILLNKKKLLVQIPMHKIGIVEGSISYSYTRFSYELNRQKQGLAIKATDTKGSSFTTLTDDYGHYILYLPTGDYKVFIDETYLPGQIECLNNKNEVQIRSNTNKTLDFVLHVKDRKIETKKFYSTSLTKNEVASNDKKDTGDKTPEAKREIPR